MHLFKKILLGCGLFCARGLQAQFYSGTAAHVSAEIVETVGASATLQHLSLTLEPDPLKKQPTRTTGGKQSRPGFWTPVPDPSGEARFRVIGGQFCLSISAEIEAAIPHAQSGNSTLRVSSFTVIPDSPPGTPASPSGQYRMEILLDAEAHQAPGQYQTRQPCRVTIHFN